VADLVAQAEANGYTIGVHKERDQICYREKHVKTKRSQDTTLKYDVPEEIPTRSISWDTDSIADTAL
jgi:hypothetical protein